MARPNESELIRLEKQYWQALKDNDTDATLRLTDNPCIVTGAQGVGRIDKQAFKEMLEAANYTLDAFDLRDIQVRMLSDKVAILAYKVHERLTVDGKTVTLEAADSSTWVKRENGWVCALHTEALVGDPFGRVRALA